MWNFRIATGVFGFHNDSTGEFTVETTTAYSGYGIYKNRPEFMSKAFLGPIPVGVYEIGPAHVSREHGPVAMDLTPAALTNTLGRNAFMIHGDSVKHPGQASQGCIILPRTVRDKIAASKDRQLLVETGLVPGNEETKGVA